MNENIYSPPAANLVSENNEASMELAKRSSRLFAAIIDGLIGLAFSIPFILLAGPALGYVFAQPQHPGMQYMVVSSLYGFFMFSLLHGYFLHTNGQTIGKKALGIRIVTLENDKASLSRLLGRRYLPISIIPLIPVIGPLFSIVDILFIFRKDRRCVHDFIAGTRVINCGVKS